VRQIISPLPMVPRDSIKGVLVFNGLVLLVFEKARAALGSTLRGISGAVGKGRGGGLNANLEFFFNRLTVNEGSSTMGAMEAPSPAQRSPSRRFHSTCRVAGSDHLFMELGRRRRFLANTPRTVHWGKKWGRSAWPRGRANADSLRFGKRQYAKRSQALSKVQPSRPNSVTRSAHCEWGLLPPPKKNRFRGAV
jgi:hypothetical protein